MKTLKSSLFSFAAECAIWLCIVALLAAPLASASIRDRLSDAIPR